MILLQVHEPKQKVDLTAYTEKHEFMFDAVLNDQVTNDEVRRAFHMCACLQFRHIDNCDLYCAPD
jgi:hypothetical protein